MNGKVTLELSPNEVAELVDKLALVDKIKLVRRLEEETWAKRLDEVVMRIRKRFKKAALSDKEISKICAQSRQKIYNGRLKSCN